MSFLVTRSRISVLLYMVGVSSVSVSLLHASPAMITLESSLAQAGNPLAHFSLGKVLESLHPTLLIGPATEVSNSMISLWRTKMKLVCEIAYFRHMDLLPLEEVLAPSANELSWSGAPCVLLGEYLPPAMR